MAIDSQRNTRALQAQALDVGTDPRTEDLEADAPVIELIAQHGGSEKKALDLGAHDFRTEPVQARSLVARLRAVLKGVTT